MEDRVESYIRKLYCCENHDSFLEQCKSTPYYLNDLIRLTASLCSESEISNLEDNPCITIMYSYPDFIDGAFHVYFRSILNISKVADVFFIYHEFEVDNKTPNRFTPSLDGFGQIPYTHAQYELECSVVQFLEQLGLYGLRFAELDEVVPFLSMPIKTIFGPQMTVQNALFRDLYGFAESVNASMAEMMTCPVCGEEFLTEEYETLDNGNPACPACVQEEQEKMDKQNH